MDKLGKLYKLDDKELLSACEKFADKYMEQYNKKYNFNERIEIEKYLTDKYNNES